MEPNSEVQLQSSYGLAHLSVISILRTRASFMTRNISGLSDYFALSLSLLLSLRASCFNYLASAATPIADSSNHARSVQLALDIPRLSCHRSANICHASPKGAKGPHLSTRTDVRHSAGSSAARSSSMKAIRSAIKILCFRTDSKRVASLLQDLSNMSAFRYDV